MTPFIVPRYAQSSYNDEWMRQRCVLLTNEIDNNLYIDIKEKPMDDFISSSNSSSSGMYVC